VVRTPFRCHLLWVSVTVKADENESIYIPISAVHRLENPGKIQLELI
jgi:mannose-6-phosphate isomerase-like protein (cupin superfamily)